MRVDPLADPADLHRAQAVAGTAGLGRVCFDVHYCGHDLDATGAYIATARSNVFVPCHDERRAAHDAIMLAAEYASHPRAPVQVVLVEDGVVVIEHVGNAGWKDGPLEELGQPRQYFLFQPDYIDIARPQQPMD